MAGSVGNDGRLRRSGWRAAAWGGAAGLLLIPLIAMQLTGEVAWGPEDFVLAAALIAAVGIGCELAVRTSRSLAYRGGAAVALGAAFMLVWANAAVGIVGSEDDPVNVLFFGVLAVGLGAAALARFRPAGMARAMAATALAQTVVGAVAVTVADEGGGPGEILAATGLFVAFWLISAALFRRAARQQG